MEDRVIAGHGQDRFLGERTNQDSKNKPGKLLRLQEDEGKQEG